MKELIMRDDYADNWGVKKLRIVGYDDLPDDYIIDEDGKMVVMPTEELYDDGSDEDEEDSSDEEKKGAFSGSADTRERRAVSNEFRRTGKGQGYDPGFRRPAPNPVNRRLTSDPGFRALPIHLQQNLEHAVNRKRQGRLRVNQQTILGNDPGFRRPAPNPRVRPAPMPIIKSAEQSLRDPDGGLTAAGRKHFKETEGANLKPGVKGAADTPTKMRRKGSFLVRFFTNPTGPMVDPKGRPTRLALSARAWGEPVPRNLEDAAKLAAKGRRLLDRYRNSKEESKGQKSFEQFELSMKSADMPGRSHGGIRPTAPRGSFTGSPGGTNQGTPGANGTRTPSGRITRRVEQAGGKYVPHQDLNPKKYFRVNESGKHPYRGSKPVGSSHWDDEAEAMTYDENEKSFDMPGRPHGGIRPSMPSGSFTGSPGGTNRGRVGETGTITASGRTTQRVYSGGRKNSRSLMAAGPNPSSYSRDKYFLVNESGNHPYDGKAGNSDDGMIEPGNIDVSKRRAVKLPGGDYGTVRSIGITDNGKEVNIPTIGPRGENWSGPKGEQSARDHYKRTGEHLGKFNSIPASNAAAQRLHEIEAIRINKPRKAYNTTSGTMDSRERASAAEGRDINSNLTRPIRGPGNPGRPKAPSIRPRPNR